MTEIPNHRKSLRGPLTGRRPNPVDVHIGQRLRMRRMLIGLSLEDLAARVGVAFQQIQKYESAANRVSTSRLWALAEALNCSVGFFYEGMNTDAANGGCPRQHDDSPPIFVKSGPHGLAANYESLALVRAYLTIKNHNTRRKIYELAASLAKAPDAIH